MDFIAVVGWVTVQDHHVGAQALEAPVFLGLQGLLHQRQSVLLHHPHEQDGEIAGDAVPPQLGLT